MTVKIRSLIALRSLDTPLRLVVLRQLEEAIEAHPVAAALAGPVSDAIDKDEALARAEHERDVAPRTVRQHAVGIEELDKAVRTGVAVFRDRLLLSLRVSPPPAEEGVFAQALLDPCFGDDGLKPINNVTYAKRQVVVDAILQRIEADPELLAAAIALGHTELLDELRTLNEAFGDALHRVERGPEIDVRAENQAGLDRLAWIMARATGLLWSDEPEHQAALQALMAPVLEVQELDRDRKRRGPKPPPPCDPEEMADSDMDSDMETQIDAPATSDA